MASNEKALAHVPEPWARQSYDTNDSWMCFQAFRDQKPPRRQRSAQGVGVTLASVAAWHREHHWEERVRAYDAHVHEVTMRAREEVWRQTAKDVAIDHMEILADGRAALAKGMAALARRLDADPDAIRTPELLKLGEMIFKMDRLVRGEPTEISEKRTFVNLSDEELAEMDRLNRKALAITTQGETVEEPEGKILQLQ